MSKIGCQLCLANFGKMCDLKAHMRGKKHKQQMAVVFPKDKCKQWGVFSHIVVMKHLVKCGRQRPILGLSLVTVCLTTKSNTKVFYLCHVCEAKCSQQEIMAHLSSAAHYVHYYNCIHPDSLSFSWIPRMNMATILRPLAFQEMLKKGSGTLQVLDLPEDLFAALETLPYTKVMSTLRENDKLSQQLRVSWPKTITMQSYLTDSGRKHTLLGVQHLVECICEGQTEKRFYLCMICHLGLRRNKIINHVISFDHIHRYISAWHPSTLLSKDCYIKYDRDFSFMMYNYAKQAAEQHGMPNNEMKKVTLQPVLFNALEATCYSVALSKLEALRKECNESSLNTAIQPRAKLAGSILNKLKMKKRNMHLSPELPAGHKLFLTERPKETEEERDSEVDPVTNEPTVKVKEEAGSECQYSESGECFSAAVTCEAPPAAKQEKEPDGAKAAVRLCAEPHTDEGLQIKEPEKEKVSFETSPEETVKEKVILKEVSLKFESKSPGRESPDTPPKQESPGGGKEVGSETQRHNVREGQEDKKAEKRQASESGGKEEGSKLRRLNSGDKMQPLTEAQNVSYQLAGIGGDMTKVPARPNSASNTLGAYVKLKARAPVVGLGALVECHCDRYAPLYLCKSCCLKIPEKNIVPHVIGCGHQMLYLRLEKPRKKRWRRSVGNAAAMHEREWGSGEAEIVELEQEDYDEIAEQSFYYGITKVRDLFGQQDSCRSLKSPLTGVGRSPDIQVVDTNPSRQCKEQLPSTAVVTSSSSAPASYPQGPSQTIKFPSETTGDINVDVAANCGTHNNTTKLTDCIDIGVGACRDVKNSPNKPIAKSHAITSQTGASSKSLETNAKAGTPFNASTGRIKSAATSKPVPSQPSTVRVVAASSQSRATISKSPVISSSTLLNSSLTATVSKFTPAPISVEAIGLGTSFKNVTAVNIAEANYSPTSSLASKTAALVNTEITSQTTATNMVCGKRYISKNAEGSAKTQCSKTSDNAAVAQSCSAPVFPSLPATMNSTPALMVAPMEPSKSQCVVGLGHLVAVMCKKRRQYYCLLCSVRLKNSVHMTSYSHRCNYVVRTEHLSDGIQQDTMVSPRR